MWARAPVVGCLLACSALSQASLWLDSAQAEDGRVAASLQEDGSPAPRSSLDLRTTSFALLSLIADGSTLRSGPYKGHVKGAVRWLRSEQDARGRFMLDTRPDWIVDQAIAAFAVAETAFLSDYRSMGRVVHVALGPVERHARLSKSVGVEFLVWAELLHVSARNFSEEVEIAGDQAEQRARLVGDLERLSRTLAAARFEVGDTTDARAARVLLAHLRDEPGPRASWRPLVRGSPRAVFFAVAATYPKGGAEWKALSLDLKGRLLQTQLRGVGQGGMWPATEGGAGLIETTALHCVTLTAYYRYGRLSVWR